MEYIQHEQIFNVLGGNAFRIGVVNCEGIWSTRSKMTFPVKIMEDAI